MPNAKASPIVFISYSHDSPEHKAAVLALSQRLRTDGIDARIDQYVEGTPEEKWPRWMLNQIEAADYVLVVCTPTYYLRFRGKEDPEKGEGADWEGTIITQDIYDSKSKTKKFIPVFLSTVVKKIIPEPLRGHTFYSPVDGSGYQLLYDFLLGQAGVEPAPLGVPKVKSRARDVVVTPEKAGADMSVGAASPHPDKAARTPVEAMPPRGANSWTKDQYDLACSLLSRPEAQRFLSALQATVRRNFSVSMSQAREIVDELCRIQDSDNVNAPFGMIRGALKTIPSNSPFREYTEKAATALYLLCASRLVARSEEAASAERSYFVHVPQDENIYCAIVVMALFGGKLELMADDGLGQPNAEHVHAIKLDDKNCNTWKDRFDRGVFNALCNGSLEADQATGEAGPLTDGQRNMLLAQLSSLTFEYGDQPLALVVPAVAELDDHYRAVAEQHRLPVLQHSSSVASKLLGMDDGLLIGHIRLLWNEIVYKRLPERPSAPNPIPASPPAVPTKPAPTNITYNIQGKDVTVSTAHGEQHVSGQIRQRNTRKRVVHRELKVHLDDIRQAIETLPAEALRGQCRPHVETLEGETGKSKTKADKDMLQRTFEALKAAGEGIEGGEKLVAVAIKAYSVFATYFGLSSLS